MAYLRKRFPFPQGPGGPFTDPNVGELMPGLTLPATAASAVQQGAQAAALALSMPANPGGVALAPNPSPLILPPSQPSPIVTSTRVQVSGGGSASPFEQAADIGVDIDQLPVTNFMPPTGRAFELHGYVALPAIGASAIVVSKRVEPGRNGMIRRIANEFVGGGFTAGTGSVIWQIFLDLQNPVAFTGLVAPDFDRIVASLGSVNNPSNIDGIRVKENQLVALIVTNVSIVVAGQQIGGRLGGSWYPVDLEPPSMSF